MSDEIYRCKTCRCPVCQTDDKASWVHELNGILVSHVCGYKDCMHKEIHGKACETPEPDFECPLKYDWDARHYWILPRVNIALQTAMQMFDDPDSDRHVPPCDRCGEQADYNGADGPICCYCDSIDHQCFLATWQADMKMQAQLARALDKDTEV